MMETKELILKAANGDSRALEQLFQRYRPMLKKMQQRYYLHLLDADDWDREARLVCFRAAQRYREDTRLTFGRYYQRCLLCRIYTLIRRQNAKKRQIDRHTVPLDKLEVKQQLSARGSFQSFNQVFIRANATDFIRQLSDLERAVFYQELAIKHSASSAFLVAEITDLQRRNALERCRRKLKRYLADQALVQ